MALARGGFPITPIKLRLVAFQLAEGNKRSGFSVELGLAGRYWLDGFLDRYPDLCKKVTKNLSSHRASGGNKNQIDKFFTQYRQWMKDWELDYRPFNIWNVDETGCPDIPKEQEVIGVVGEKPNQTVSGEKGGEITTVVTFACAGGLAVPPMLIFKGARIQPQWREAAPSGYALRRSPLGYINAELFAEYGQIFIQFLKDKKLLHPGQKHMLILDSHSSHVYNWEFMSLMKKNGIEVVSLPPHCTHILQPLDDVPFGSLKIKWNQLLHEFNTANAGRKMTKVEFFKVFVPAYTTSTSEKQIKKGFENTGIYPVNRNAPKILKKQKCSEFSDKFKGTHNLDLDL